MLQYFPLLQQMLDGILPFYAQPGQTENEEAAGNGINKRQTQKNPTGKKKMWATEKINTNQKEKAKYKNN